MNHCVPDFEMEDNYLFQSSSGIPLHHRSKKPSLIQEEGIMELLWHNGQVVMQNQSQRSSYSSLKKSPSPPPKLLEDTVTSEILPAAEPSTAATTQLFMQEDDMTSWLHYNLDSPSISSFNRDLCADLLYPTMLPVRLPDQNQPSSPPLPSLAASRPPIPPARRAELHSSGPLLGALDSRKRSRESTVVDSSETPPPVLESRVSTTAEASSAKAADGVTAEVTVTSSPGGSGSGATAISGELTQNPPATAVTDTRKRSGAREGDEECHSEDVEFEYADAKMEVRRPKSAKRSRAAEVHNLSERRRRDRINEKMRALQELIPRCNKSDKASMLDEAIEYLKSLQMQVQMMSMGCSMVPMMFPNVQPYMTPMGMGMGMGMSRPMMPFPSIVPGSTLPVPAAAAHLGPKFPIPGFHMQPVHTPDPSSIPASNQTVPMLSSVPIVDPHQHFLGLHQVQLPLPQDQPITRPSTSKPSTSRGAENSENHQFAMEKHKKRVVEDSGGNTPWNQ